MRWFGGHLGTTVSALVDGQLDAEAADRAWAHVVDCASCRGLVEREAWIKRRLSMMGGNEPSARLLGSLRGLGYDDLAAVESYDAWAEVERIEHAGRGRRRAGFALAGAGSVSAAVLGFAALGSFGLGPVGSPAASISDGLPSSRPASSIVPTVAEVHGRLRGWRLTEGAHGVATAVPAVSR